MTDADQQATTQKRPRSPLIRAAQWTLLAVSLIAVIYALAHERETIREALRISPSRLALIVALLVIYFIIYSYRFVILIEKHCNCRIGLLPWLRMLIVVRFMNNTVPQMGTIYRGVHLKRDFGVSYTDYISANLFFILTDTMFNFAIAGTLLVATGNTLSFGGVHASLWLSAAFIGLVALPYLVSYALSRVTAMQKAPGKIVRSLSEVAHEITTSVKDARYMLHSTFLALLSFMTMAWVFQTLLQAVDVNLPFATLAVFYALYRLTFHVSLTPGNIGIREIAYGLLCVQADVGMSKGILVSAELRILSMIVLLLLGVVLAWRDLQKAWASIRSHQRGSDPASSSN
jgi:uncharacterized membrane protein YbhN (UPF0104 family)